MGEHVIDFEKSRSREPQGAPPIPPPLVRRDPERLAENFRTVIQRMTIAELQVLLEVQAAEYADRALPGGPALMDLRDLLDPYRR